MSAAPPGLSRPHASFIGTVCQGIHHTPMTTTPNKGTVTTAKITITEKPQRHRNKTRHHKGIVPKRSRTNPRKHTPEKGVPSDSNHSTNTRPHHGGRMLASTIQFSNHHPTKPSHTGTNPRDPERGDETRHHTNPTQKGKAVAAREPNSTHHTNLP